MPRLRQFTASVGQSGVPSGPRADASMFGGQEAGALTQLARTGMGVGAQLQEVQERRDTLAAQRDAAVLREQSVRHLDELRQTGEPVGEKFQEFLDSQVQALRDKRTTQSGLLWAERVSANMQSELGSAARSIDARLAGDEAKEAVTQAMQSNGVFLQTAPQVLPDILMENRDFVEQLSIPEDLKEPMLREMNSTAARNAALGWLSVDPYAAKDMLQEGQFDEHLTPEDRIRLLSNADTRIRGLEEGAKVAELEERRRREIESQTLMSQALVDLNELDPSERLDHAGIVALASQTFPDGSPKLEPPQVSQLFTLRRTLAEEGSLRTHPATLIDMVGRLDRLSEAEVIGAASRGELSMSDFQRLMDTVREGDTPLRKTRTESLDNLPSFVGLVMPDILMIQANYGQFVSQAQSLVFDREKEYRAAGKNPIEYYRDGTFEADVRQLGSRLDILGPAQETRTWLEELSAGREVDRSAANVAGYQIGDRVRGFIYLGGPVDDYDNSWVPVSEIPQ